MPPVQFTPDQLKQWFSGKYFHPTHDESVEKAESIRVHADGIYPKNLIEERRPHESEAVKEYRASIWEPITEPYFGKVLSSLGKIRRSTEWSVKFNQDDKPSRIQDGDTLEDYLMSKFPRFTSLTNWAFSLLLREYAIDANAWIGIMPDDQAVAENQFVNPQPHIFPSQQIIDFDPDQYLVILSTEKVTYNSGNATHVDGDRYYIFTPTEIQRWDQTDTNRQFLETWYFEHNLGYVPAFQMRGVLVREDMQKSRLAPMVPRLNEAAREYSDLQAEVVQHIHSEKWEIGEDDCSVCNGSGKVQMAGFGAVEVACAGCNGTGCKPRGPYTTLMVKPSMGGEAPPPTPPMGYLTKDTNIVEVQDKRIEGHIFHALAAVNMEFLMQKPIDQSGVAKAYDADETNNFVHGVAEDLVAMLDDTARIIDDMRYSVALPNLDDRQAMLPTIAVPERFDLFSAQMVEQELLNAKSKNINPLIVNAIEIEYANKKFSTDPDVRDQLALTLALDPLPNIPEESKVLMLQNKGITPQTYIVSCNVYAFINRAIDEKGNDFFNMDLKDQKALMYEYAKEQEDAGSMEKQLITDNNLGG